MKCKTIDCQGKVIAKGLCRSCYDKKYYPKYRKEYYKDPVKRAKKNARALKWYHENKKLKK